MEHKFSDQQIDKFRIDTPGCKYVNHLNNAGAALMPQPVIDAIQQHIQLEAEIGGYEAAGSAKGNIEDFYNVATKLLNSKVRHIAFTANATDSYTRALSSIPFKKGDIILTSTNDYTSNLINFISLKNRFGIEVKMVKNAPEGGIDLNDLDEQLKTHQPKLLSITHIPTNSGLVQPAAEIGAIVEKYDTLYLLDACQSVGQLELDVQQLKCDFLSATSRKFLRGPRGAGFLYVSDRVLDSGLEPLFIDLHGASLIDKDHYIANADASRFEDWETAYALLLGTKVAIEYFLDAGPAKVWRRANYLATYTREKLQQIDGLILFDKGPQLCSIITFAINGISAETLKKELAAKKINAVTSQRYYDTLFSDKKGEDWAVRISPHYYNTVAEIDNFIEELKLIVRMN